MSYVPPYLIAVGGLVFLTGVALMVIIGFDDEGKNATKKMVMSAGVSVMGLIMITFTQYATTNAAIDRLETLQIQSDRTMSTQAHASIRR